MPMPASVHILNTHASSTLFPSAPLPASPCIPRRNNPLNYWALQTCPTDQFDCSTLPYTFYTFNAWWVFIDCLHMQYSQFLGMV